MLCNITMGYNEKVFSFANNINTIEGGTHLSGFRTALTRTLNMYAKNAKLLKDGKAPTGDDYREGSYCYNQCKSSGTTI